MQQPGKLNQHRQPALTRVLIVLAGAIGLAIAILMVFDLAMDRQQMDRVQAIEVLAGEFKAAMNGNLDIDQAQQWISSRASDNKWLKEAILIDTADNGRIVAAYPEEAIGQELAYRMVLVISAGQEVVIQNARQGEGRLANEYEPLDPDSGYIQRKAVRINSGDDRQYILMLSGSGLDIESGSIGQLFKAAGALDGILRLMAIVFWLLLALWIYRDAVGRKTSALAWGFFGLIAGPAAWAIYRLVQPEIVSCLHCGSQQMQLRAFCTACGGMLTPACTRCRQPLEPGGDYCGFCGSPVITGDIDTTEAEERQ